MKKSRKTKNNFFTVGGLNLPPNLIRLRGDLAVMPKEMFKDSYACDEDDYWKYFRQFGASDLSELLRSLFIGIALGEIKVSPQSLTPFILMNYKKRYVELNLIKNEKDILLTGFAYC